MLDNIDHSAKKLLTDFKTKEFLVNFFTEPWIFKKMDAAINRGAHPSCNKSLVFLCEEFADMINKGQFVVLLAEVVKKLLWIRVSPMEAIP